MTETSKEWPQKEDGVDEVLSDWRSFISARPALISLLYDIDMLPEQCVTLGGAIRLSGLCWVWKAWESGEPSPTQRHTHRHKKRGENCVLIGIGKMQAKNWLDPFDGYEPPTRVDMREVAIYRSVDDGSLWVRPREEFEDGRFEEAAQ